MQAGLISPFNICLVRLLKVIEPGKYTKANENGEDIILDNPLFPQRFRLSQISQENLSEYLIINILVCSLESGIPKTVEPIQRFLGNRRAVLQLWYIHAEAHRGLLSRPSRRGRNSIMAGVDPINYWVPFNNAIDSAPDNWPAQL